MVSRIDVDLIFSKVKLLAWQDSGDHSRIHNATLGDDILDDILIISFQFIANQSSHSFSSCKILFYGV